MNDFEYVYAQETKYYKVAIQSLCLPSTLNEVHLQGTYFEYLPKELIDIISEYMNINWLINSDKYVDYITDQILLRGHLPSIKCTECIDRSH